MLRKKRKAKKFYRSSRNDLVLKICRIFNLPNAKKSFGYFTRQQLIELVLKIENLQNGTVNAEETK
jgi:hypothetical protein